MLVLVWLILIILVELGTGYILSVVLAWHLHKSLVFLACAATGKNRFTQEDAFGVIERGRQVGLMDFNLGIGGGSTATTYDVTVTAPSSAYYTLNGQTREGSISGNDINVRIFLGDTINFNLSGVSSIHPFKVRQTPGGADVNTPTIPNNGLLERQLYLGLLL